MALTWVKIGNLKGPKGDVGTWYQRALTADDNIYTLPNGVYTLWGGGLGIQLGLPEDVQGDLEVVRWGAAGGLMEYRTRDHPVRVYERTQLSGGWMPWVRTDAGSIQIPDMSPASQGGSGLKTVPLALTLGNGGSTTGTVAGSFRQVLNYAAPIFRWRWCFRDGNPRYGTSYPNAISLTGMWLNGTRVMNSASATGDTVFRSPWVQGSPNGALEIGYTATQSPRTIVGGGGISSSSATAGTGAGYSNSALLPFEQWLEVETLAGTPTLGWVDSSTGAGVGATAPVHESPLSIYCRQIQALPMHYSHSGDSLQASLDPEAHKWNQWPDLARPDAVLFGLSSNDIFAGRDLAVLREHSITVMGIIGEKLSTNIYARTIAPRSNASGGVETVRRQYNDWLRSQPGLIRDVFEFSAKVSSDDENITPAFDSGDGVHLNTAGYTAGVSSFVRPMTVGSNTLVSPNGTRYRLSVSDTGEVVAAAV